MARQSSRLSLILLGKRHCIKANGQGHRSLTMVTAMTQYAVGLPYAAIGHVVNDNVLIMPMIETEEGLANVEWVAEKHFTSPC